MAKNIKRKQGHSEEGKHGTFFDGVTVSILTPIILGIITAFVTMYIDIDRLKAGEKSMSDKIDTIHQDTKDIKWFLIEQNGGNIIKKKK